jgi:hypothetical protein
VTPTVSAQSRLDRTYSIIYWVLWFERESRGAPLSNICWDKAAQLLRNVIYEARVVSNLFKSPVSSFELVMLWLGMVWLERVGNHLSQEVQASAWLVSQRAQFDHVLQIVTQILCPQPAPQPSAQALLDGKKLLDIIGQTSLWGSVANIAPASPVTLYRIPVLNYSTSDRHPYNVSTTRVLIKGVGSSNVGVNLSAVARNGRASDPSAPPRDKLPAFIVFTGKGRTDVMLAVAAAVPFLSTMGIAQDTSLAEYQTDPDLDA